MSDNKKTMKQGREFIAANLAECCRDELDWKNSGLLRDGKLRKAAAIFAKVDSRDALSLVQSETMRQAMQLVAAQQPAADSRATGDDGEMPDYPPLPWREEDGSHDFEAWLESRFDMDVAKAFWSYARTYGQQCRDVALERAAVIAETAGTGLRAKQIAAAIRALKGGK